MTTKVRKIADQYGSDTADYLETQIWDLIIDERAECCQWLRLKGFNEVARQFLLARDAADEKARKAADKPTTHHRRAKSKLKHETDEPVDVLPIEPPDERGESDSTAIAPMARDIDF